ncbi:MAG: chitobiase/beta-hexosaminidase C-terminal domain-containing protein [Prevotella sp.]|nr:chitobiase/beta-hexosaminidase C-terminal domain-containing protein [Prevotella sp.]
MKKTLRFSLLSMLLMLCGSIYADEVKFDFSTDNAYSLFGLSGFSSGTGDSYVSDGDITENKSTTSGDVTVTVSPCDGKNPNRMWAGSLRMYGGTLTIASSGKNITAIEFTLNNSKWGNNTANTGTLETGKWTGNAASVVITVGGNTQIKSMTVTLGEGGSDPDPDPDPDPQPGEIKKVTVAEFNAAAESTDVWYQLSGTVKNLKDGDEYGNFDLEDETGSVYVYGLLSEKGGEKKLFQELAEKEGIKNGTKITIIGNRGSYKGKIEVTNAYFVSVDGQGDTPDPQPEETKKATIAEFNAAPESSNVWYQLSGTVKNLKDGDQYGNFDLEDETGSVYVYGLLSEKGGEKKQFQALAAEKGIKNGTKITICGNRGSYGDKIEVVNAYFVSVDGQGDTPEPQPDEIKDATIAEFNAAAESTDVWYKLKGEVKNLKDDDKYGNFDLEDATGSVYVYGLLAEKGGEKGQFQALAAAKGIKNGCKITLIGNRGSYKDKIEVMNAYFVSVDEAAPAELTISGEANFDESTVVTITPSDVDHDVYYTLDGSDPKTSSTNKRYMEPFTITETCTVKAWEEDADIYAEKKFTKNTVEVVEVSVEDVIAAAPENTNAADGQQKVWVKGYIVGYVEGQAYATGAHFDADGCETKTNLLLATNYNETNVENCIPVQLPNGDVRNDLNLQDHPDNLGKEVKLYGYVLKYFSVPGFKNVTAYEFTGNTSVNAINADTVNDGKMYNVAGQRVDKAYKGIVIVGGKKIVVK